MQTSQPDTPDRVTLYYRAGSSDKVYQAAIEPAGDGLFTVQFAFGRRGTTLQTGTKTQNPVPYQEARSIFTKLVREKTGKGYTPGEDGTPYAGGPKQERDTGVRCQLLNPVEEPELAHFLDSPDYAMQEKFDGRRMLLRKAGGTVTGINRQGLEAGIPAAVASEAGSLKGDFLIDGEAVGDVLHVFDILTVNGIDLRYKAYETRLLHLEMLLAPGPRRCLLVVSTVREPAAKREMFGRLRREGREGVVFKRLGSPYAAGRPASGGPQVKFKFYETASCIVTGRNDRRSVSLGLMDDGRPVACGNVTIPAGRDVPAEGALVEVRYLYAFPQGNTLFQPVYLGPRDDLTLVDCALDQLKYKAA